MSAEPSMSAAKNQKMSLGARFSILRPRRRGLVRLFLSRRLEGLLLREAVEEVLLRGLGELELRRHQDTDCGAGIDAELAIAAERHVDVELDDPLFDGGAVGGEDRRFVLLALLGGDIDAVHGADLLALLAADAVLDLDVEPHAGALVEKPLGNDLRFPPGFGVLVR